ncbi:MAG: transcriptional regulator, partial [Pseudomonadota bacterium]
AVESKIQAVEAARAANVPTENLYAWSAYHRGLWHMYRFNPSDTEIAQNMFQRAVDADKNFCRAYAGLSYTNFQKVFQLYTPDAAHHRELARRHAEKSLELDPMDPFANLVKGRSQWLEGDVESALEWTSRSTEINPNYATALYNKALLNSILCNGEGGAEDITKAIGLSPIDPLIQSMLAIRALSAFLNKDNESALSWAGKALRAPNLHPYAVAIAAIVYGHNGKDEEARQCVEKIRQQNSSFTRDDFFARFSMKDASILEHSRTLLKNYGL